MSSYLTGETIWRDHMEKGVERRFWEEPHGDEARPNCSAFVFYLFAFLPQNLKLWLPQAWTIFPWLLTWLVPSYSLDLSSNVTSQTDLSWLCFLQLWYITFSSVFPLWHLQQSEIVTIICLFTLILSLYLRKIKLQQSYDTIFFTAECPTPAPRTVFGL